jgi:hypothetical protein
MKARRGDTESHRRLPEEKSGVKHQLGKQGGSPCHQPGDSHVVPEAEGRAVRE